MSHSTITIFFDTYKVTMKLTRAYSNTYGSIFSYKYE